MLKNIAIAVFFLFFSVADVHAVSFTDVVSINPYSDAISYVQDQGIVRGYMDGSFGANKTINRAEFIKIIIESTFADEVGSHDARRAGLVGCFPDVKGQWYSVYVCLARTKGIISGHADGMFRPDRAVNFSESAKILSLAFGYTVDKDRVWYRPYVLQLEKLGAIPFSVGSFSKALSRGEMAEMIYRLKAEVRDKASQTYAGLEEEQEYLEVRRKWKEMVLGNRTAVVKSVPFREDMGCVQYFPGDEICKAYRSGVALLDGEPFSAPACDIHNAPVCGVDGKLYSNSCWADHFGVAVGYEGICREVGEFMADIWLTRKINNDHYVVPHPYVSFREQGGMLLKSGTYFRSTVWEDDRNVSILNFDVLTDRVPGRMSGDVLGSRDARVHPLSGIQKTLIVYVMYDNLYPEELLHSWTQEYGAFMNSHMLRKQHTKSPVQYDITSVVIDPPASAQDMPLNSLDIGIDFEFDVADTAFKKIGASSTDFTVFALVFVYLGPVPEYAGYKTGWDNPTANRMMESSVQYLGIDERFIFDDPVSALEAQIAFQTRFNTISHEMLHEWEWLSDHMPDDLDERLVDNFGCGMLGDPENYFGATLSGPTGITVGEEPDWLDKVELLNGDTCFRFTSERYMGFVKDTDDDGYYELIYANNPISDSLAEDFGWRDVDSDGVAEVDDLNPYGGFVTLEQLQPDEEYVSPSNHLLSDIEVVSEEAIGECRFVRVRLLDEDGREGLVPLECEEFNYAIVNIYEGVQYSWREVEKSYGTVFLPALQ
jgi:hypothetical protein